MTNYREVRRLTSLRLTLLELVRGTLTVSTFYTVPVIHRNGGSLSRGGTSISINTVSLLKKKIRLKRYHSYPLPFTNYLLDEHGLYVEDYFVEILQYEIRRAERSRRPFLVMILNIENILQVNKKNKVIRKIASALFSSTREIDLKGWYKHDSAIGAIFTEINGMNIVSLQEKIYNEICNLLGKEEFNKIKISFYLFPEEHDNQEGDSSTDLTLYPEFLKIKYPKRISLLFKRIIDVIGSIAGLIIFSPFFITIPICIKLTSKGPILFRQVRVGQSGKKFTFLKFRSMYVNNDQSIHQGYIKKLIHEQKSFENGNDNGGEGCVYKIKDDPRITPVGRFLRKTSLDELPQFLNVLKAEMSLVGPRPPIPYEIENYDLWHKRRVLGVKPGITGLWQVNGRSSTTFDDMVRLDIKYIREWSFWLDIKILFKTPLIVIAGRGAY